MPIMIAIWQDDTPTKQEEFTEHNKLTADEWLNITGQLSYAECKILLYLRLTQNDSKSDAGVRKLAKILDLNPGTVSRALKVLTDKGFI